MKPSSEALVPVLPGNHLPGTHICSIVGPEVLAGWTVPSLGGYVACFPHLCNVLPPPTLLATERCPVFMKRLIATLGID